MQRLPVDPSLSLMDKWLTPTKLSPAYYWGATRNGLSSVPGILTVVFLLNVIRRKPAVYSQYKYTVVLLTFGGYILMLPIMLFNLVVSGIVTYYDGSIITTATVDSNETRLFFVTSVWACSLAKHTPMMIMNCNFCIGFIISLMRYLLILHGIEMNWPRITIASIIVMVPNFVYLGYMMFFGVIVVNDCCERMMEVPESPTSIYIYAYLMVILIAAVLINFRTLHFLLKMKRMGIKEGSVSNERANKDQFQLTLGFLLQSFSPLLTFGPFIVFIVLYFQGILGPDLFSTYTNVSCYLSTFLNPIASMIFIPMFRRELFAILRCRSVENSSQSSRGRSTLKSTVVTI